MAAKIVFAKILGGNVQEVENVSTVGEVAAEVGAESGYTATVNGETAELSQRLRDNDYVTFAKATKGGK